MASLNVKSADRVLRVLSRFAEVKCSLRATEIARDLGMPLSSCAELLATMVGGGFLSLDTADRSYLPTEKVKVLGDWLRVQNPLERSAIDCARRIHRECGLPVAVSHRSGLFIGWNFTQGVTQVSTESSIPALRTVNGIALLSRMSDNQIIDIVSAHNDRFGRQKAVQQSEILSRTRSARNRDYASGPAPLFPGIGSVCFYLSDDRKSEELLLSVVLPLGDLAEREASVVRTARKYIRDVAA